MISCCKVSIILPIKAEEISCDVLRNLGSDSIEIKYLPNDESVEVIAYYKENLNPLDISEQLSRAIGNTFENESIGHNLAVSSEKIKDWVKYQFNAFGILDVTERIAVVPPWKKKDFHSRKSGKVPVIINPGSGFGTGEHPTTRCCIIALEKYLKKRDLLLDFGAGSGILSIIGAKLGAGGVDAIEIDPQASCNGLENIRLNKLSRKIHWHTGSLQSFKSIKKYDCIIANIVAETILFNLNSLIKLSHHETIFIFSGITIKSATTFEDQMNHLRFIMIEKLPEGEWCTFVMNRNK